MKEYDVEINGITHRLQLSADDAKRYPDAAMVKASDAPSNKSRSASNK